MLNLPLLARRRRRSNGAITLTMTGLTSSEARPGDHASISAGFPTGVTAWSAQAWGVGTYGDDTYGTGGSPTDYTAGDGLTLLWEGTGDDGKTYRASAPIRYAVGTFAALTNQSFTDDTGDQTYVFDAATGTGLTWTYALVSPPSGVTIVSATRTITFDTNALALQTGTAISVSATDQYGRAATGSPRSFDLDIVVASGFDPSAITGMVAAWDAETVYQEAALSTSAGDGDPVGGFPDLAGNGNILSQAGSARPTRQSGGGLFWADFDGTDDRLSMTLPTGQRTSDMTLLVGLKMGATETDFLLLSSADASNNPFVGWATDASSSTGVTSGSGLADYYIDNTLIGSQSTGLFTRDAWRDAVVAAGACVVEIRSIDMTTSSWTSFGTLPTLFNYRSGQTISAHDFYRAALVDNATISAGDLTATREWVAAGAGVTL